MSGRSSRSRAQARVAAVPVSPASGTGRSMNWDCPPSRHGATTLRRATRLATSRAVVAADHVQEEVDAGGVPGGGEDVAVVDEEHVGVEVDRGEQAAEGRAVHQCVVAGRPSSRPAAASTNAPVQIETSRADSASAAAGRPRASGSVPSVIADVP